MYKVHYMKMYTILGYFLNGGNGEYILVYQASSIWWTEYNLPKMFLNLIS